MKIKPKLVAKHRRKRRGTAAVEAAMVLPVLIIVTFGAIDIAQYINLSQLVSNASREGGRAASRATSDSVSDVEAAIESFFSDALPSMTDAELGEALSIEIQSANGDIVSGTGLASVESGSALSVNVSFDFSVVRWLAGPSYWNNDVQTSVTYCRRE